MTLSKAATAWAVTGALGVTSFAVGVLATAPGARAEPPRPAVTVTVAPGAGPTATPTAGKPSATPTATKPSATPTATGKATPTARPATATATMVSPPSPVSAPSAPSARSGR